MSGASTSVSGRQSLATVNYYYNLLRTKLSEYWHRHKGLIMGAEAIFRGSVKDFITSLC